MSKYDEKYLEIVEHILDYGYYDYNRTGMNTYKLPHQIMQFDLAAEFPILTTKKVAFKTAVKELLWIFKEQSNDVRALQAQNVKIWNEWMMNDGTIGTSYGWVVKKYEQMDTLIHALKENPQDRRMMINLWQIPYLDTGALYPCCFLTMWDVTDGRLNVMLVQRSGDMGLGVPFNTTQYAVLAFMLAQATGHKPGLMTHVINNAHIYENHIEGLKTQLTRKSDAYDAPGIWLNPAVTDFYDFTPDDIKLVDYRYHDKIEMEVSV
ncbi:MAG: thymidylate synthase [Clostridiales bacterium]|jgi:thymidylate synthase|nr:thymidylate synthase [Clostridiales bacterium]